MKEFVNFVEWHVNSLAMLDEERYNPERSSLRVLCRIDVGVLQRNNGLHYFVNEVERGPSATLFGREDAQSFLTFARSFLEEFSSWFKYRKSTIF